MTSLIAHELERRLELWRTLVTSGGARRVRPQRLRELRIYGGAQGIWVDHLRTRHLTPNGAGVAVALLHTGRVYADDLSEDGVLYHYPTTGRAPGRDLSEIESTKAAGELGLPVFVITPASSSSAYRDVHLSWVEAWDDEAKLFLVSFGEKRVVAKEPESADEQPFSLRDSKPQRRAEANVRQGQQRFRFLVLKRYGSSCAVCGMQVLALLTCAHLCPKEHRGSDDPRNGLVLCAIHHKALDCGLFAIHPDTRKICYRQKGPNAKDLRITCPSLNHLTRQPHREALQWLWQRWRYEAGLA